METKKKRFDAVALMREARQRIEAEWAGKPRSEQIEYLRKRYRGRTAKKKG